jgi:hypothetical protein
MHPTTPASPIPEHATMEEKDVPTTGRKSKADKPIDHDLKLDLDLEETKKKPAILSSEGTTQKMAFMERHKPIPPPSSLKKLFKRKYKASCKI